VDALELGGGERADLVAREQTERRGGQAAELASQSAHGLRGGDAGLRSK